MSFRQGIFNFHEKCASCLPTIRTSLNHRPTFFNNQKSKNLKDKWNFSTRRCW